MRRLPAFALIATMAGCGASGGSDVTSAPEVEPAPIEDGALAVDTAIDDTFVAPVDASPEIAVDSGPPPIDRSKCTASPDALGLTERSITLGGKTMKYLGFAPAGYDMKTPLSLVLALHGAGDTAKNYFAAVWQANATSKKFLVVTPDGTCAAGPGNTWCSDDGNRILAALDDFEACYSVDARRRILNGFSAGGVMAYAIGLQAATSFAGISISAANLNSAEAISGKKLLPAPWKIPLTQFHGTMDMNFPIATARTGRDRLLADGHVVHWHEFDGGHTTTAAFAATMYDDLASSKSP